MLFRRSRHSPIGVSLEGDGIRLLQLEHRGDEAKVHASAAILEPANEAGELWTPDLAAKVRKTLKSGGFQGHRAVVSVPAAHVVERHVKVDSLEGQALHDQLLFELEPSFPNDVPIVQHLNVGEVMERGEKRHELIVLAASLKAVQSLLGFLESADLEPVALDSEGCALVRCYMQHRRRACDINRQTALVHIGPASTLMTITAGGHPMFMKQLPLGALELIETVRKRLDLAPEEFCICPGGDRVDAERELSEHVAGALRLQLDTLALELSACLRYHAASRRGTGPLDILLTGLGSELPGLANALGEALAQPISRPDPFGAAFSGIPADRTTSAHFPLWSIPLGLALREVAA